MNNEPVAIAAAIDEVNGVTETEVRKFYSIKNHWNFI